MFVKSKRSTLKWKIRDNSWTFFKYETFPRLLPIFLYGFHKKILQEFLLESLLHFFFWKFFRKSSMNRIKTCSRAGVLKLSQLAIHFSLLYNLATHQHVCIYIAWENLTKLIIVFFIHGGLVSFLKYRTGGCSDDPFWNF